MLEGRGDVRLDGDYACFPSLYGISSRGSLTDLGSTAGRVTAASKIAGLDRDQPDGSPSARC